MQSQYGSLHQAAAAQDYMEVGRRLVKLDGSSISWGESIVRNLLCIVDHLPYSIRISWVFFRLVHPQRSNVWGIALYTQWQSAAFKDTTKLKKAGSNHNSTGACIDVFPSFNYNKVADKY